jgi:hypothetical protein
MLVNCIASFENPSWLTRRRTGANAGIRLSCKWSLIENGISPHRIM